MYVATVGLCVSVLPTCQEELKILRLARALLAEEEVIMREDQLNQLLDEKKSAKVLQSLMHSPFLRFYQ